MRERRWVNIAGLLAAGAGLLAAAGCIDNPRWNRQERRDLEAAVQRLRQAAEASQAEEAAQPPLVPKPQAAPKNGDVPMTLAEAIRLALVNNQDIQTTGFDPLLAETDLVKATAVYDPSVFLNNNFGRTDRPIQSTLDTGAIQKGAFIEDTYGMQGGLKQHVASGGTFSIYQEANFLNTNSKLVVPDPQWATRFNVELAQPLLKGFGDYMNRGAIRVANLNEKVSLQDFRQKVMEVTSKIVAAYWQLSFDREAARIARRSLEQAQEVLRREQTRKGRGLANEMDTARALSAVGSRQADVIRAENRARNDSDNLKRLLHAPEFPLDGDATLIPADKPRFFVLDVDRAGAMSRALARRPEIDRARSAIAINQVRIDVADRERLPKLDAALKYTMNSLAPEFHDSLRDQNPGQRISWSAGVEFELPIGNRATIADYRRRIIEYEQSLRDANTLVDQVLGEVSAAVRAVLQGRDEIESTLQAKTAADQLVRAEFARFELGGVSNDELLRSQDTQAAAERDYLMALLNFNLSLTELARSTGTLMEERGVEIVWPAPAPGRPLPLGVRVEEKGAKPPAGAPAPAAPEAAPPRKDPTPPPQSPAAPGPDRLPATQVRAPGPPEPPPPAPLSAAP